MLKFSKNLVNLGSTKNTLKYFFNFFSKSFFSSNFLLAHAIPKYISMFTPFFFFKVRLVKVNKNYATLTKVFFKKFPENSYYFYNILSKNKFLLGKKPYLFIKNHSYNHHKIITYLL